MAPTWQQVHNSILKRAQLLYAEISNVRNSLTPDALAEMLYSKKAKEHHMRTLCRYIRAQLSPDVLMATEAIQCHGMVGPNIHSWFAIEADEEAQAQEGFEQIPPGWGYIIDPQFPEVTPQILMVAPGSPLMLMYNAQEAKRCTEYDRK